MSYLCQKYKKNWGVTNFVLEIEHIENYPNFDKSVLVTRHGPSGCWLKAKMIRYGPTFLVKFYFSGFGISKQFQSVSSFQLNSTFKMGFASTVELK